MMNFFRNLGFGSRATPVAGRSWGSEEAGASGPEPAYSWNQFDPLDQGGYDPHDPQFGAVGPNKKKKWKAPSRKSVLEATTSLLEPIDITQGMPAPAPFRMTGGLLR